VAALPQVFASTCAQQRCVHETADVLDEVPWHRAQVEAKSA
jgi:hypothetical protein